MLLVQNKGADYFAKSFSYNFTIKASGKVDVLGTKKGTLSFAWDGKDGDNIQTPTAQVTTMMIYEPDGTNAAKMVSIGTSTQLGGVFSVSGGFYDVSNPIPSATGVWNLVAVTKLP